MQYTPVQRQVTVQAQRSKCRHNGIAGREWGQAGATAEQAVSSLARCPVAAALPHACLQAGMAVEIEVELKGVVDGSVHHGACGYGTGSGGRLIMQG